jgi:colanic acid/amylovoran biosynthesis glycosyltransferase
MSRPVAYLLTLFPGLSETFVLNEVAAVEQGGLELRLFSYKRPSQVDLLNPRSSRFQGRVEYGGAFLAPRLLLLFLVTCLRRPLVMGGILARVVLQHLNRPLVLAKTLVMLPKTLHFARLMQQAEVSRLHSHFGTFAATGAWVIHRLTGIPYTFTVHAHDLYTYRNLLRTKMDEAEAVVCNSEFNRQFLLRCYPDFPPERLPLIRTGIHVEQFQVELPDQPALRTGPARILAVGRVDPTKGYDQLVRVVDALRRSGREVEADVVGHVTQQRYIIEEHARLLALVKELGLEGVVRFHERLPFDQLLESYRRADLFLLPCVTTADGSSDGLPSVLVEAAAAGLPLVTTRISGIPELVEDGVTGRLLAERDLEGLTAACSHLLDDPALALELARAAQRRVLEHWEIGVTSRKMRELLVS